MWPAQFASVDTCMTFGTVPHEIYGMVQKPTYHKTNKAGSSILKEKSCAPIGKSQEVAECNPMTTSMNAQGAEGRITELRDAILLRNFRFSALYKSKAWECELA